MSGSTKRRVVILGGGMAGMAAAWRLSEPGWQDHFESITLHQRGARLGGKGASSRSVNGRVEEHGLHLWLGYYDNAFRLLRDCYDELDRARTDPEALIQTWTDALKPSVRVGLEDQVDGSWEHWMGEFAINDLVPGDPDEGSIPFSGAEFVRRALRLLADFYDSVSSEEDVPVVSLSASSSPPTATVGIGSHLAVTALGLVVEAVEVARQAAAAVGLNTVPVIDQALAELRQALLRGVEGDAASRRMWHLISVILATVRGVVADGLLGDASSFRAINDEDYRAWILRHGAAPEAADSTLIRGLYDLVFGYADGDPARPGFAAGLGVFLSGKTFFDYKGAIFWKMQAGMGDVVFAPMYEALVQRGVRFEFFSRVDGLHLDESGQAVDTISLGRQVALRDEREPYQPLVRVKGLPCFPDAPREEQLRDTAGLADHDLESMWCTWPDVEQRVLTRGQDFDDVVFAIPVGMARHVCQELVERSDQWRTMTQGLGTVATQAFQIWLAPDEPSLGWPWPGATVSGFAEPFDTWASMPQLLAVEDWPAHDLPGTIAYFCNTMSAPPDLDRGDLDYPVRCHREVRENATRFLDGDLAHLLPGSSGPEGFRWELLCGAGDRIGRDRFDSQFWTANVDPSDLYVQSLPGTDHLRLRPDASGFENLYLAGDWTDNGLNAGCIESAVLSGLQAANAVLGRPLRDRILGQYLP